MPDPATCPVDVPVPPGTGTFKTPSTHVCGRKVKAEGLCGIHLAAKRRRERNKRMRRARWKAGL